MKRSMIALALAATASVAVSGVALADSTYTGGYYINGGVGRTDVNKGGFDTNDTGYLLNGGYRWGVFGVEVGYTDLGSFDRNVSAGGNGFDLRGKVHGPTLGGNVHVPVGDNFYLSGRAGVFHFTGHEDFLSQGAGTPVLLSASEDGYKPYGGVGFGYDFSNNVSVGVNYDYYSAKKSDFDLSTKMYSVNAEYRF